MPAPVDLVAVTAPVAGTMHLELDNSADRSALEIGALKDRAGRDFQCAPDKIAIERGSERCAARVAGCGKRDVYLRVHRTDWTFAAHGYEGLRALLTTLIFVPITSDLSNAKTELTQIGPKDSREPYYYSCFRGLQESSDLLQKLNERAALDLECPRAEVYPEIVGRGTPVAEGCGKRATYLGGLPLRLSSIVSTKNEAP
jgi:hypothetical protein